MRLRTITALAMLGVAPAVVAGQEPGPAGEHPDSAAAVSVDSAAVLRAAMERPPGSPGFDFVDGLTLPFEVATFPLFLFTKGTGWVASQLFAGEPPPPFYLRALRDANRWGAHLGVSGIGPRSGPALGLEIDRWEPFFFQTAWSIRESQRHRTGLRWGDVEEGAGLEAAFTFNRDAEPHFWGIGPGTPDAQESDFLRDRVAVDLAGAIPVARWLSIRAVGGWEDNRVDRGFDGSEQDLQDTFDVGRLFGADERTEFVRAGLGATLDLTRRQVLQERGLRVSMDAMEFFGVDDTPSDFHRLEARVAGYVPVNGRQSLVLRSGIESRGADSGRGVPFTHLAELGSEVGGRGYSDYRFTAEDKVWFSGEWRFMAWRELRARNQVEGFIFFEEGTVKNDLSEISSSDWRPSWGGGLRFVDEAGTVLETYLAGGEEGLRFEVETGVSF